MTWWRPGGRTARTEARPLVVEGCRYPVERATLTQYLTTERWDATTGTWSSGEEDLALHLALELHVDDRSGIGGELAPDLRVENRSFPCPPLTTLTGVRLDELGTVAGRYGTDGPPLEGIEITLTALRDPAAATIQVDATYRWLPDRPVQRLAFAGPVAIEPVRLQTKDPDDAARLPARAFGPSGAQGQLPRPLT